jgi:hypothetical protein
MAERLASRQMLHLHGKLRVAPLNIVHARTLERGPRCGEALKLTEKLSAFLTGKSDECCSRIVEARAIMMGEQSAERPCLAVAVGPNHHEGGLREALGLEPRLAAARAIWCQRMLLDEALKATLRTCLEECSTLTIELITKLNATLFVGSEQGLQD